MMIDWLVSAGILAAAIAFSLGGVLLVRRSIAISTLESHNEVAGFIYAIIGVIYAVLIAFMVFVVWEQHKTAETRAELEAMKVGDLYRESRVFPASLRDELQGEIVNYITAMIEKEWPSMHRGALSQESHALYLRLWKTLSAFEPRTDYEKIWYAEAVHTLNELGEQRRLRILSARSGLPLTMWVFLIAGGMMTIAYSFFFGTRNALAQYLMVAALAVSITLVLLLINALDHPFTGIIRIGHEPFASLLQQIKKG
jgi:hypothetical protein